MSAELYMALAKAQGAFPSIPRSRTVTVRSRRTGAVYTFSYAPLETILTAVRPALAANGLAIIQRFVPASEGRDSIETLLLHGSGASLCNKTPVIYEDGAGAQAFGSAQSYARRYGLTALLCLAAEDDDDANIADDNEIDEDTRRNVEKNAEVARRNAELPEDPGVTPEEARELVRAMREQLDDGNDEAAAKLYRPLSNTAKAQVWNCKPGLTGKEKERIRAVLGSPEQQEQAHDGK